MYLFVNKKENNSYEYYAIDSTSGGYAYWSSNIEFAKIFNSIDEIRNLLKNSDFVENSVTTDGTIYPPTMIHSASGINFFKPKGNAKLSIVELKLEVIEEFKFDAEIIKAKGFKY